MVQDESGAPQPRPIGRSLDGRYRLEAEIGVGGLGSVYRATHEKLAKTVAVKVLHQHCGSSELVRSRFEREAKALAALDHPNIVAISDYGISDGTLFLVMELLEGETLAERLGRGPLDPSDARRLATELLAALQFVHERGLVHRDVKPSNVFVQRLPLGVERIKVLDFGLAKFMAAEGASPDPTITRDGAVIGTPAYMSPEQASGESTDAGSDVYSAGVILFQMLAGRTPFEGDAIEQLRSHLIAIVPKLNEVQAGRVLRPELDAFLLRALAKRREERFADAGEMLAALVALPEPWVLTQPSAAARAARQAVVAPARAAAPRRRKLALAALGLSAGGLLLAGALLLRVDPVSGGAASESTGSAPSSIGVADAPAAARGALEPRPESNAAQRAREALNEMAEGLAPVLEQARASEAQLEARLGDPSGAGPPALAAQPSARADERAVPPSESPAARETAAQGAGEREARLADEAAPGALAATGEQRAGSPPSAAMPAAAPAPPPAARNPWLRGELPKELRQLRAQIQGGSRGTERTITSLRRYNREHVTDVRGNLLLARLYLNREWRADAVHQFSIAHQRDPSSRGAPEMLSSLLACVVQGQAAREAERLIELAYAREAISAIDRSLRAHQDDLRAVARLTALRGRIRGA